MKKSKKKKKNFFKWFFTNTDRGEENIARCRNLYELIERLQYRVEDQDTILQNDSNRCFVKCMEDYLDEYHQW